MNDIFETSKNDLIHFLLKQEISKILREDKERRIVLIDMVKEIEKK